MKFLRAGRKSKLKVEPGSTLMITNRPVWDSCFTMFLLVFPITIAGLLASDIRIRNK